MLITVGLLLLFLAAIKGVVVGEVAYYRHLSDLRIRELENLAIRLEHSINNDTLPCEEYYDYVCGRSRPIFTILGHLPSESDLINLLIDLQNDNEKFEAKHKLMDYFLSCNMIKSIDDCYRETFDYFRPVFGYIVAAKHLDRHDHANLLELLDRFIERIKRTEHFATHSLRYKFEALRDKFKYPQMYFQVTDLNKEYQTVTMYPDSYDHNHKSLEAMRKGNLTYMSGIPRTILDWTMYMYQSRNKPMSYYYSTLSVHLWMMFYNSSSRMDQKKYADIADCLRLPAAINALDEARLLSVIYIKSFDHAWTDYRDWITMTPITKEIYDQENEILQQKKLHNRRLFFTLYAQNFCDFGKQLAENVFFLPIKRNQDFYTQYSCGYRTIKGAECG